MRDLLVIECYDSKRGLMGNQGAIHTGVVRVSSISFYCPAQNPIYTNVILIGGDSFIANLPFDDFDKLVKQYD